MQDFASGAQFIDLTVLNIAFLFVVGFIGFTMHRTIEDACGNQTFCTQITAVGFSVIKLKDRDRQTSVKVIYTWQNPTGVICVEKGLPI